ncbi:HD domain-containing protein [Shewanella sp. Scap07]|uniref:HD domain-containing phosphohydrolase n=1 Tax=Shewanella sp. Scap07 TaxID=2589987 RepID=UPI0015BD6DF3|nr:HD domain-containing phosphohydrolase [Shewanella sp. Scap07]QLE85142.1 HD domain-containing protein [Shewanella sp. Scap07]
MIRLLLYIIPSAILITVVMAFVTLDIHYNHQKAEQDAHSKLVAKAHAISTFVATQMRQDQQEVDYLAQLISTRNALNTSRYKYIEDIFTQMMLSKPRIVQARLIDNQGLELFKIVQRGGAPQTLDRQELQDKSGHFYFKEMSTQSDHELYISKVSLNRDYGVFELPHRPVVRIGKAVLDDTGNKLGSVILNYDVNTLFNSLNDLASPNINVIIVDKQSQFLLHPNQSMTFCEDLGCNRKLDFNNFKINQNGLLYYEDIMAFSDIFKHADNSHYFDRIVLQYKADYQPTITANNRHYDLYLTSHKWWGYMVFSFMFCILLSTLLYKNYQRIQSQIQKMKMHAVLEKVTELIERLHEGDDPVTGSHVQRVSHFSRLMAVKAKLPKPVIDDIHRYASLHDLGKITTPDAILSKPGKLDPHEWEVMKLHVENGYNLIREFNLSPVAENIVYCHHERWDGTGYPRGLSGNEIPIEAQIVSIVDCFDALMSIRPYKPAYDFEKSSAIINELSGKAFNPELVATFNQLAHEFRHSRSQIEDRTVKVMAATLS